MRELPPFGKLHEGRDEPILDPDIPIIDTHHHLFNRPQLRFLLDEFLEQANLGHKIVATVYMETLSMARPDGPEVLRPIGEIEFANGMAAICASGTYGDCRVAAGIVGNADMRLGDRVAETLDAAMAVAPGRFRGIRQVAMEHPDPAVMRYMTNLPPAGLLRHPNLRPALRQLAQRGLSFDTAVFHTQLPELGAVAAENPDNVFVLNHAGMAFLMGLDPSARAEAFGEWRANMRSIARNSNVYCKIGGLGMSYWGFGFMERPDVIGFRELAEAWQPFVEVAMEAFGAERCMAESNFPNDGRSCGWVPLWNGLKYAVRGCSQGEKEALFSGTARRVYRI